MTIVSMTSPDLAFFRLREGQLLRYRGYETDNAPKRNGWYWWNFELVEKIAMWEHCKKSWKDLKEGIVSFVLTTIVILWLFWYTGHFNVICNNAGCVINWK